MQYENDKMTATTQLISGGYNLIGHLLGRDDTTQWDNE